MFPTRQRAAALLRFCAFAFFVATLMNSRSALAHECKNVVTPYDRTFERTSAAPDVTNDTFVVPTTEGEWFLTLEGVGISTGSVELNGRTVFASSDFKNRDQVLRKSVIVGSSNALRVTLAGSPGDKLRVHLDGVVPDTVFRPSSVRHVFSRVFFEQRFGRGTTSTNFTLPTADGLFWLEFENGDVQGNRVTSGTIDLNGAPVFTSRDFGQQVTTRSVPVIPALTNALSVDLNGNPGETLLVRVRGYAVDPAPPSLSVDAPPEGVWQKLVGTWTSLSFSDAISGIESGSLHVEVNGAEVTALFVETSGVASCSLAALYPPLVEGANVLHVAVRDQACNEAAADRTILIDSRAPSIGCSVADGSFANSCPRVTLTFSDPMPGSGVKAESFTATLDGQSVTESFANVTVGGAECTIGPLVEGEHVIVFTLSDVAGNATSRTVHFVVDARSPSVSITPRDGATTRTRTTLSVQYSDPQPFASGVSPGTFSATLDGVPLTFDVSPAQATAAVGPLAPGTHVLVASIEDFVGNRGEARSTFVVVVPEPSLTLSPADGSATTDTLPLLTVVHVSEEPGYAIDLSTAVAKLDGHVLTAIAQTSSESVYLPTAPLTPGAHVLEAEVKDTAGNTARATAHFNVEVSAVRFELSIAPASSRSVLVFSRNDLTIRALTQSGLPAKSFIGTIEITTSDGLATLDQLLVDATLADEGTVVVPNLAIVRQVGPLTINAVALAAPATRGSTSVVGVPAVPVFQRSNVASDGTTTLTIITEPNTTVFVTVDGIVVASGVANAEGRVDVTIVLSEGVHAVTVSSMRGDGTSAGVSNTISLGRPVTVSGLVYSAMNTEVTAPLSSVQVTLEGTSFATTTDVTGRFTFSNVPTGRYVLRANGTTASGNYGTVRIGLTVDANLTIPAIGLPVLDYASGTPITLLDGASQIPAMTVTNPALAGVRIDVLPGTIGLPPAPVRPVLTITEVSLVDRPVPVPSSLAASHFFSLGPEGATLPAGYKVTLPNSDGVPPGETTPIWQYVPEEGRWVIVGDAVASADGSSLVLDPVRAGILAPQVPRSFTAEVFVSVLDPVSNTPISANEFRVTSSFPTSLELPIRSPTTQTLRVTLPRSEADVELRATRTLPDGTSGSGKLVVHLSMSNGLFVNFRLSHGIEVSGRVTTAQRSHVGVRGVLVTCNGVTTVSDAYGNYYLSGVQLWTVDGRKPAQPATVIGSKFVGKFLEGRAHISTPPSGVLASSGNDIVLDATLGNQGASIIRSVINSTSGRGDLMPMHTLVWNQVSNRFYAADVHNTALREIAPFNTGQFTALDPLGLAGLEPNSLAISPFILNGPNAGISGIWLVDGSKGEAYVYDVNLRGGSTTRRLGTVATGLTPTGVKPVLDNVSDTSNDNGGGKLLAKLGGTYWLVDVDSPPSTVLTGAPANARAITHVGNGVFFPFQPGVFYVARPNEISRLTIAPDLTGQMAAFQGLDHDPAAVQVVLNSNDNQFIFYTIAGTNDLPGLGLWGRSIRATRSDGATKEVYRAAEGRTILGMALARLDPTDPRLYLLESNITSSADVQNVTYELVELRCTLGLQNVFVQGSAQSDGDGLPDDFENAIGSSPTSSHSDGDPNGLDDFVKVVCLSIDPRTLDADGDGLPDRLEFDNGSNYASFTPVSIGVSTQQLVPGTTNPVVAMVTPSFARPTLTTNDPSVLLLDAGAGPSSTVVNFAGPTLNLVAGREGVDQINVLVGGVAHAPVPVTVTAAADRIAPSITGLPASGSFTSAAPTVTLTFSDPFPALGVDPTSFSFLLDGVEQRSTFTVTSSGASGTIAGPLSDGSHELLVSLADKGGNSATFRRNVITDASAPFFAITPAPGSWVTRQVSVDIGLADRAPSSGLDLSSLDVLVDGTSVRAAFTISSSRARATLGPLSDGLHRIQVSLRDNVQNLGVASFDWNVDSVAPTLAVAPTSGSVRGPTFTATATFSDAASGVQSLYARVDGTDVTSLFTRSSNSATATLGPLAEGGRTVLVGVVDQAGNVVEQSTVVSVDASGPNLSLSPADQFSTYCLMPEITLTHIDAPAGVDASTIVLSLDGTTLPVARRTATTSTYLLSSPLTSGTHVIQASAADVLGNSSTITSTFTRLAGGEFTFTSPAEPANNAAVAAAGVTLSNGQVTVSRVDLAVPGRAGLGFVLARTYKSNVQNTGELATLGVGWQHSYDTRVRRIDANTVEWLTGTCRAERFVSQGSSFISPKGCFCRLLGTDSDFRLRWPDGTRWFFRSLSDPNAPGALAEIRDRHGNRMTFEYGVSGLSAGRLIRVRDPYQRAYDYSYDTCGRISTVQDFFGRTVRFDYSDANDLVKVTSPTVTTTTTGTPLIDENKFPSGRAEVYGYTSGSAAPEDDHKLAAIVAPREAQAIPDSSLLDIALLKSRARIENTWATSGTWRGRVTAQRVGGTVGGLPASGGVFSLSYSTLTSSGSDPINDEVAQVAVYDRVGNLSEWFLNAAGQCVRVRQHTNRDVRPPLTARNDPGTDPEFFESSRRFNSDGLTLEVTRPLGNKVAFVYDASNVNRNSQANLLSVTRTPDARGDSRGGARPRVTTFVYEPIYNAVRTTTDPRGNDPTYVPQNGGAWSATRYTATTLFDYQQNPSTAAALTVLAAEIGFDESTTASLLLNAGLSLGLGDLNEDPSDDLRFDGDAIRAEAPDVSLVAGQTRLATAYGSSTQRTISLASFNSYGQPTRMVDPERNVHFVLYNSSHDPDGDGQDVAGTTLTDASGGYPRATITDALSDTRRESGSNPTPTSITRQFSYDRLGNVVSILDGRGIAHQLELNELDEVVVSRAATDTSNAFLPQDRALPALSYVRHLIYDANGNVVETRVGNQGERDGTGTFVAANPWWTTKVRYDLLDQPFATIREVDPLAEVDVTETSPGVIVTRATYDPNQNVSLVTQGEGNQTAFVRDERDLLFQVTRGFGSPQAATVTYHYDANGGLQFVVDAVKNNIDKNTRVPTGDLTEVVRNGFDEVDTTIDAERYVTLVVRGPLGEVLRQARYGNDEEGNNRAAETAILYDELGRPFQTMAHAFTSSTKTPSQFERTIPTIASSPYAFETFAISLLELDRLGRAVRSVDTKFDDALVDYDGAGRVVHQQGPLFASSTGGPSVRNESFFLYDGESHQVHVTRIDRSPLARIGDQTFEDDAVYDAVGRTIRTSDNRNFTHRAYWDSRSNLIAATDGRSSVTIPDPLSLRGMGAPINGDGNIVRQFFDGLGRPIRSERLMQVGGVGDGSPHLTDNPASLDRSNAAIPTGLVLTQTIFDKNNRVIARIDANGNPTLSSYDPLDRCDKVTFADLKTRTCTFDADGNVRQTVDPNGSVIATTPDALGRTLNVNVLSRATDLAGTGQAVLGSTLQAFEYDPLSRIRAAIDDNGSPAAAGVATELVFDSIGRKVAERQKVNCDVRLTSAIGLTSNYRFQVTDTTATLDHQVGTTYQPPLGAPANTVLPAPTAVSYPASMALLEIARDGESRPTMLTLNSTVILTNEFRGCRCAERETSNEVLETVQFCQCGCPREVTLTQTQTGHEQFHERSHHNGNNDRENDERLDRVQAPTNFAMDSVGSVTNATTPAGPPGAAKVVNANYQFDGVRNFVEKTENGLTTKFNRNASGGYLADLLNRYQRVEAFDAGGLLASTDQPKHDAAGAQIADKKRKLYFDAFERLVRVDRSFDGGATYQTVGAYTYDAFGRRVTKDAQVRDADGTFVRGEKTAFVLEGAHEIEELDLTSGALKAYYVFGTDQPDDVALMVRYAADGSSTAAFLHHDLNDSVVTATDWSTGAVLERYEASSIYGKHSVTDGGLQDPTNSDPGRNVGAPLALGGEIGNPFRFQGRRFDDESGLYYFRNRYLDPEQGRFVSRDPIGIWGDPGNLGNGYAFAGGNPVNRRDPFGLWGGPFGGPFSGAHPSGDGPSFLDRMAERATRGASAAWSGVKRAISEPVRELIDVVNFFKDRNGGDHRAVSDLGQFIEGEMASGKPAGDVSKEIITAVVVRGAIAVETGGLSEVGIAAYHVLDDGTDFAVYGNTEDAQRFGEDFVSLVVSLGCAWEMGPGRPVRTRPRTQERPGTGTPRPVETGAPEPPRAPTVPTTVGPGPVDPSTGVMRWIIGFVGSPQELASLRSEIFRTAGRRGASRVIVNTGSVIERTGNLARSLREGGWTQVGTDAQGNPIFERVFEVPCAYRRGG